MSRAPASQPRGAVLFDAAGTLIELRQPIGETYARLAGDFGVVLPHARLEDAFRRIFASAEPMEFPDAPAEQVPSLERDWWRRNVRSTFLAADSTARFSDFDGFFDALFRELGQPTAWRAMEGVAPLLIGLRERGFVIAVVSNFDHRLPAILEGLGLAPLLDAVVLASDVGHAKPHRAAFVRALALLAVPARRAVVVGDDPERDLAGARSVGAHGIDVRSLATLDALIDQIEHIDLDGTP